MTTNYPDSIDNNITLPPSTDNLTPVAASVVNALRDAIVAVEKELGVKPSTIYGTVRSRLDTLESIITGGGGGTPTGPASGDLGLSYPSPKVIGIQGRPIASTAPSDGYILTWSATDGYWEPKAAPAGFSAGGDLRGSATSQQVISLTGLGGLVNIPSASLEFGAHSGVAQSGLIRLGNVEQIATNIITSRNYTNTGDVSIISTDGSLDLYFGSNSMVTQIAGYYVNLLASAGNSLAVISGHIQSGVNSGFQSVGYTGIFSFDSDVNLTEWKFNINGANALGILPTEINIPNGSHLSFPDASGHQSSTGLIRLGNVISTGSYNSTNIISARNSANTSDIPILWTDAASDIYLTTGTGVGALILGQSATIQLITGYGNSFGFDDTSFKLQSAYNSGFNANHVASVNTSNHAFTFDSDSELTSWQFNTNATEQFVIGSGFISVGSTGLAQSGLIRLGDVNNNTRATQLNILSYRNTANNADYPLISTDGFGDVLFSAGAGQYGLQITNTVVSLNGAVGNLQIATTSNSIVSYIIPAFKTVNVTGAFTFDSIDSLLTSWKYNINGTNILSIGQNADTTNALITSGAALQIAARTITGATYTVDGYGPDQAILVNRASPATITLPSPRAGRRLLIKDSSGNASTNNISILHHSSDLIDGYSSFTLATNYGSIELVADGTNWSILGGIAVVIGPLTQFSLLSGVSSTTNDNTSKLIIGACYFTPLTNHNKVYLDCIIQTSSPGTTVNLDLFDVSGITLSGIPTVISSSLVSYSTDSTLHHVRVEITALESVTGSGVITAELYSGTNGTSVVCYGAQLIITQ